MFGLPLHAYIVFKDLLEDAIDCKDIPQFDYYASMTTAHAQRKLLTLLDEKVLYKSNGNILIKVLDRLCFIEINKPREPSINVGTVGTVMTRPLGDDLPDMPVVVPKETYAIELRSPYGKPPESAPTIRITLPFSPKHFCKGVYKGKDLKRITQGDVLRTFVNALLR